MDRNPTGASLLTARVPRKSRSPSAETVPPATSIPSEVATARSVTPAHATSAWSSMSPEHSSVPSPPVAGWRARAGRRLPGLHRARDGVVQLAARPQRDDRLLRVVPVGVLERLLQGL